MAKRRTRSQKEKAATRHSIPVFSTSSQNGITQFSISTAAVSSSVKPTSTLSAPSHAYVVTDIRKTISITLVLIAMDIAFYFLLKSKFISIPGIGF